MNFTINLNTVKSWGCYLTASALVGWGCGSEEDYIGLFTIAALLMIANALFDIVNSLENNKGNT